MRFLLDQPISRLDGQALRDAGYDAVHVSEYGLLAAKDEVILDRAVEKGRIIITQDTDFGTLLSAARSTRPSIILFRLRRPALSKPLFCFVAFPRSRTTLRGAGVVITESMIRIRRLPVS